MTSHHGIVLEQEFSDEERASAPDLQELMPGSGSERKRFPKRCAVGSLLTAALLGLFPVVAWLAPRYFPDSAHTSQLIQKWAWCGAPSGELPWLWWVPAEGPEVNIKVMSFNLFWWHLYGKDGGEGGAASHLIAQRNYDLNIPLGILAFQECENIYLVMQQAFMLQYYDVRQAPHSLCMAIERRSFEIINYGVWDVAEDFPGFYGRRAVQWARLKHYASQRYFFVMNHHGPLPMSSGGICGPFGTAWHILNAAKSNAVYGDGIILAGDFNSASWSPTIKFLQQRLGLAMSGWKQMSADHIFSNSANWAWGSENEGPGGSDHDAISSVLKFGKQGCCAPPPNPSSTSNAPNTSNASNTSKNATNSSWPATTLADNLRLQQLNSNATQTKSAPPLSSILPAQVPTHSVATTTVAVGALDAPAAPNIPPPSSSTHLLAPAPPTSNYVAAAVALDNASINATSVSDDASAVSHLAILSSQQSSASLPEPAAALLSKS